MAISVAVAIGEDTADAVVERLTRRVQTLKIGPSDGGDVEMGPLVTQAPRCQRADSSADGLPQLRRLARLTVR
jgi:acyl-CoA reductase-like NAD-dependent aldehyde dehydrogenase